MLSSIHKFYRHLSTIIICHILAFGFSMYYLCSNMNTKTNLPTFRHRAYGRTELAQMYCPTVAAETAWRKLRAWIALSPGLTERLAEAGYSPRQRAFTPRQVQLIVVAIGEP